MKRACSLSVVVGCFALVLLLFPAAARAAKCSTACTSTASCSLTCNAGGAAEPDWITCGEWGTCAGSQPPPPTCTPNWVTTTTTGGFAVNNYNYMNCTYYHFVRTTKHDTNGCQADQVSCVMNFFVERSDFNCCYYYWCGGETCGY